MREKSKQPKGDSDVPVFYDKSGRRWTITQAIALLFIGLLVVFFPLIIPAALADQRVTFFQNNLPGKYPTAPLPHTTSPQPSALAAKLAKGNTPVIGRGPLVRVVEVRALDTEKIAADPFTGRIVSPLTAQELEYIDKDHYVLQRYGETSSHRIALTFDDGPHPIYTPQILDLLSREKVPASFFVTGDNIVKYPDIARRIVHEGHVIGNHTFSHINFTVTDPFVAEQEINQSQRVITSTTHQTTSYFRAPYGGESDQSLRNSLEALLTAQKLGYVNTSYHFDSNDWQFPIGVKHKLPPFDGGDKIVLVHDGGGDRSQTVNYVQDLIASARKNDYSFANLNQLYPQTPALNGPYKPSIIDDASFYASWSMLVLPRELISILFVFSLVTIAFVTILNVILASIQHVRSRKKPLADGFRPKVSVIIPAYNEETVLEKTVRSLVDSSYRKTEIIIVDDGSTDKTWLTARKLARKFSKVTALHQQNGGKSSALNNGIRHSRGSIIIGVDADTVFLPNTIWYLVRHFEDKTVGAVAGVVKVGNVKGMLTRWQAMEYALSIAVERNAHALLGSIMIVPGACGAWRKSAIKQVGGLSHSTLAEDCDLTFKIQALGRYRILQENDAISYTEAPQQIKSLAKQRFRWTFGSIQALRKHRRMMFNEHYSFLGMMVMPYAAVSIIIPLLFWPLLSLVTMQNILAGNYSVILLYFAITLGLQFIFAFIGLLLARAPLSHIVAVPVARFIYGPIRVYILYKSLVTIMRGSYVGWNKLTRTGEVAYKPRTQTAKS